MKDLQESDPSLTPILKACWLLAIAWLTAVALFSWLNVGLTWDEGWNAVVARNVLVDHVYGAILDGQPYPAFMAGSWPVIAVVYISLKLFGVGIVAAKAGTFLFTVLFFISYTSVIIKLFDLRTTAILYALMAASFCSPYLNPAWMGPSLFGEVTMLLWIFIGLLALLSRIAKPLKVILTGICWGMALVTKYQLESFFVFAAIATIVRYGGAWRNSALKHFAAAIGIALIFSRYISNELRFAIFPPQFIPTYAENSRVPSDYLKKTFEAAAVALDVDTRGVILRGVLVLVPIILVTIIPTVRVLLKRCATNEIQIHEVVRFWLGTIGLVWLGWFLCMSIGFVRYAFPPFVLMMPFLAGSLNSLRANEVLTLLRPRRWSNASLSLFCGLIGITYSVIVTLVVVKHFPFVEQNTQVEVSNFLSNLGPTAKVELWEPELMFLTENLFHFPPESVQLEVTERLARPTGLRREYTPPHSDVLVIGPFARQFDIYGAAAATCESSKTFKEYSVYWDCPLRAEAPVQVP